MSRPRLGMALAVIIGVVSLISILAVATLSLSARIARGSRLASRDAQLDAAAASGLAASIYEWRPRNLARLAVGASLSFPVSLPNIPVSVTTTVTRVAADVYWVVSDVRGIGEASRRENLILRFRVPSAISLQQGEPTDVESLGFISIDSIAAIALREQCSVAPSLNQHRDLGW